MAQYTTILANEFNSIRSTVASVLGTGVGSRGYGSPVTSYAVSTGSNISYAEFDALKTDINVCYGHIAGSASSVASVVAGGDISWSNIVTYQVAATYIDTNRDSSVAGTTASDSKVLPAGWGNASGNRVATLTGSFNWSSADAMRYFFNQNGYLNIYGSGAASGGSLKSDVWGGLANSINFNHSKGDYRPGAGTYQTVSTTVAPYSSGTPSTLRVDMYGHTSTTIPFQIECTDKGGDDGDSDGITVDSNIDIDLTFYFYAREISNLASITDYRPTISIGGWSYAA
jgi:hypothetical protein